LLLQHGAAVDAANRFDGGTPLMWAAVAGDLEVCSMLLRSGASANATNKKGYTPLYRAAYKDHAAVVRLLLVCGADPLAITSHNKTAIDLARELRHEETLESFMAWKTPEGQEAFKHEFPDAASNYVASNFLSGSALLARQGAAPRQY
jgi:hypothetical protein